MSLSRGALAGLAGLALLLGFYFLRGDRSSGASAPAGDRAPVATHEEDEGLVASEATPERQPASSVTAVTPEPLEESATPLAEPSVTPADAVFYLAGTLELAADVPADAEHHVEVFESIGSDWKRVADHAVAAGAFGPFAIPRGRASVLLIRVESAATLPDEREIPMPAIGETVSLDLRSELGHFEWFAVTEPDETPIPGATVKVSWRTTHGWTSKRGQVREDGYLPLSGIKAGSCVVQASHPGYVAETLLERVYPMPTEGSIWLILTPAATVRGRCTLGGEPVEDFTIAYWQLGELRAQRREFTGAVDGEFELTELPPGEIFLVASSLDSPGCEPVLISGSEGDVEGVALELRSGVVGRGVAVDAVSGEPLPEATVQGFVRGAQSPVMRWGAKVPARPDGSFEVRSLLPGENHLDIEAPGYAPHRFSVTAGAAGEPVEVGEVRLHRSRALTFHLEGATPEACAQHYMRGAGINPSTPFEPGPSGGGIARFPTMSPGFLYLTLSRPDGSDENIGVDLGPEASWEQTFLGGGGGTVEVDLGSGELDVVSVTLGFVDEGGAEHLRWFAPSSDRSRTFVHVQPGTVRLTARVDGVERGRATVAVYEGQTTRVPLLLGDSVTTARVIDGDDEPIAGVWVRLNPEPSAGLEFYMGTTGADGSVELGSLPPGPYVAHLTHPERGVRYNVPVDVPEGEAEVELELDAQGDLTLLFVDGEEPIPGVTFAIADLEGRDLSGASYLADGAGRATLEQFAPCAFRVSLFDDRLWRQQPRVDVSSASTAETVQVRRMGDLILEVRNSDALAVPGVEVGLQSLEFDEDVATWIDAGRAQASEGTKTDVQGRLHVEGLPHGDYLWRIDTVEGPLEGLVTVEPLEETKALIAVP